MLIQTVRFIVLIISIPDAALQHLSKSYDVSVGFARIPLSFEAVYCFICGRRRVAT